MLCKHVPASKRKESRAWKPVSCAGERRSADTRKVAFTGEMGIYVGCQQAERTEAFDGIRCGTPLSSVGASRGFALDLETI